MFYFIDVGEQGLTRIQILQVSLLSLQHIYLIHLLFPVFGLLQGYLKCKSLFHSRNVYLKRMHDGIHLQNM